MKRWTKTLAAGLVGAGIAAGQAPPATVSPTRPASSPGATDGPRPGDVTRSRSTVPTRVSVWRNLTRWSLPTLSPAPDRTAVVPVSVSPTLPTVSQRMSDSTLSVREKPPAPVVVVPPTESKVSIAQPTPVGPRIRSNAIPLQLSPRVPTTIPTPMALETDPYLRDLFDALRPSVRQRAATALAEGRYGWRPEIQEQLVMAAAHDPSPDVRAHCVRLLSQLGYHEARYRDDLAVWAECDQPALRQAARDALAKLNIKK